MKRFLPFLIVYLVAVGFNIIPTLFYPDVRLHLSHFFVSGICLVLVTLLSTRRHPLVGGAMRLFLYAFLCIFLLMTIEPYTYDVTLLNAFVALHIPLTVLFVTPFFGILWLIPLDVQQVCLVLAFYFLTLCIARRWVHARAHLVR